MTHIEEVFTSPTVQAHPVFAPETQSELHPVTTLVGIVNYGASSQVSFPTTLPSPHIGLHRTPSIGHSYPISISHKSEQPSFETRFPSSQSSEAGVQIPSPLQVGVQFTWFRTSYPVTHKVQIPLF